MRAPTLRPLRIGELLDAAITVYRSNAGTLLRAVLPFIVPLQVLGALVSASALPDDASTAGSPFFAEPSAGSEASDTDLAIFLAGSLVNALLIIVAGVLATAACFKAVTDAYLGGRPDARESVRFALSRVGPLLWLALLGGVLNSLAFLALVIPGIWLYVAWSVASPALLAEDVRGRRALGRSYRLVRGRWWPTAGALVVALILVILVEIAIGAIAGGVLGAIDNDSAVVEELALGLAGVVAGVLATPFQAAVAALLYIDLRVRKEGLDVELLARATEEGQGAPPTLPPPPPSDR